MDLSVALVGERRMSQLHDQFMGLPQPTDVLTFELEHDSRGRVTAGEVIACVPVARREASRRKIPVQHELLLYCLHGLLHLSGFDDTTEPAFRKMHAMEDRILTQLGIGSVFRISSPAYRAPSSTRNAKPQTPNPSPRKGAC